MSWRPFARSIALALLVPVALLLMLLTAVFAAQLWMLTIAGVGPGDVVWVDVRAASIAGVVARLVGALVVLAVVLLLRRNLLAAQGRRD